MKKIIIETIPQGQQRYDTSGDYQENDESINFKVSSSEDPRYEQALILHELVEKFLNMKDGISDQEVDEADMNYKGPYYDCGLDPTHLIHGNHMKADAIERIFCIFSGIDFEIYDSSLKKKRGIYGRIQS